MLPERHGNVTEVPAPRFAGLSYIHEDTAGDLGEENLVVCLSLAKSMMSSWAHGDDNPTTLYADAATNMASQSQQWDAFISPHVEERLVGLR